MIHKIIFGVSILLLLSACSDTKEVKKEVKATMKCGAGKCGTNMFDSNSALAKKKNNILSQMREDDTRKECVQSAKSTKALYDCVRSPITNRLSLKCGNNTKHPPAMKCAAGKCGQ